MHGGAEKVLVCKESVNTQRNKAYFDSLFQFVKAQTVPMGLNLAMMIRSTKFYIYLSKILADYSKVLYMLHRQLGLKMNPSNPFSAHAEISVHGENKLAAESYIGIVPFLTLIQSKKD